jgi:hypothetical protein
MIQLFSRHSFWNCALREFIQALLRAAATSPSARPSGSPSSSTSVEKLGLADELAYGKALGGGEELGRSESGLTLGPPSDAARRGA